MRISPWGDNIDILWMFWVLWMDKVLSLDLGPKTDSVQVRALEEASVRLVDQGGQ